MLHKRLIADERKLKSVLRLSLVPINQCFPFLAQATSETGKVSYRFETNPHLRAWMRWDEHLGNLCQLCYCPLCVLRNGHSSRPCDPPCWENVGNPDKCETQTFHFLLFCFFLKRSRRRESLKRMKSIKVRITHDKQRSMCEDFLVSQWQAPRASLWTENKLSLGRSWRRGRCGARLQISQCAFERKSIRIDATIAWPERARRWQFPDAHEQSRGFRAHDG